MVVPIVKVWPDNNVENKKLSALAVANLVYLLFFLCVFRGVCFGLFGVSFLSLFSLFHLCGGNKELCIYHSLFEHWCETEDRNISLFHW